MAFWTCSSCICVNKEASNQCEVCQQTKKLHPSRHSSTSSSPSPSPLLKHCSSSSSRDISKWGCRACTFLNNQLDAVCDVCRTPKSSISLDAFAEFDALLDDVDEEVEEEDDDDDRRYAGKKAGRDENKVGKESTKFWPLRSCSVVPIQEILKEISVSQSKAKDGKETFPENLEDESENDRGLFKNRKESPSKNTKIAKESLLRHSKNGRESPLNSTKNVKQSTSKNKKDSVFKSSKHSEEFLFGEGENLASNMVQSSTSNGSMKRKSPDDGYGSSNSVFEVTRIERSEKPQVRTLVKQPGTVGAGNQSVLVLTYNVWFREDLELAARMNAIGGIICEHDPHFVCLQEVTPAIYNLFQSSSWWNKYQCSVTPSFASKRAYFCLQLSRIPNTTFSRSPYTNSVMGRDLCCSKVGDMGGGRELLVATTHLESPCPSPPTWDQMFSEERIAQANQAFHTLKDHPNVVFCGDMNWEDKLDGEPPLPQGWCDAWLTLRPKEEGLTYDSKQNPMLSGSNLRKRLDRFFCHLNDFTLESIERVGMKPIPGVTFEKEMKMKKKSAQAVRLPVLPSDHFGLLLKISPKVMI